MEIGNKKTILIEGVSGSGKTSSFQDIPAELQKYVLFLNCEGKELPFAHDMTEFRVTEPYQVHLALKRIIEGQPFKHKSGELITPQMVGLDSFTFLMDMFVAQYVNTAEDTRGAWGDYATFIRTTMLDLVAKLHIPFLATTHILQNDDMENMEKVSRAAIQGGIGKGNGLEAYFTTVVYAKRMRMKDIKDFIEGATMLTISEEEEFDEKKHVFVTRPAKQHSGDRIKSPRGMFSPKDLYMDNSIPKLITHINDFYNKA
jgi:hypothetical protein